MIVTRDQLRAARMLLRLSQDELAVLSKVGIATIRRFEGGHDIGALHLDALQRSIEGAGAVLIAGDRTLGDGVALKVAAKLPKATRVRLEGAERLVPVEGRKRGRPRRRPADGEPSPGREIDSRPATKP